MKSVWKRCGCVALSLLLCLSLWTAAFAAGVTYPGDVTPALAQQSVTQTDTLIKTAAPALTGKSLQRTIDDALFADETLSSILTSVYTSIGDQGASLLQLGLDTSPAAVAKGLTAYPGVARALLSAADWNHVDLSGAKWNVGSKNGFASAVSAMLTPFNDLLYMLLCGGTYRAGLLILRGEDGYENGLVPILSAAGCRSIPSKAAFVAAANKDRRSMMRQIVLTLYTLVEGMVPAPMTFLCDHLPPLAAFIRDGGLEAAVDALLRPITLRIGSFISLFTGSQMLSVLLFLQNPGQYTGSFSDNVTVALNNMLSSSGLTLAQMDLDRLKGCAGNRADAFMDLLHWVIDTLRLNTDKIADMMAEVSGGMDVSVLLNGLNRHSTEELMLVFIRFLTTTSGEALDVQWDSAAFERTSVDFTKKLKRRHFKRVLQLIDPTLNELAVGFGGSGSLSQTIHELLYDSKTLTALTKLLYGAFAGEEMQTAAKLLGLPATPAALAAMLPGGYSTAKRDLRRYASWDKVTTVSWGIQKGSRVGFETALTAVLSPLRPFLEAFLANGAAPILGGLRIGGTNGYNTAVIPLLEALSCPANSIKTYAEYVKGKGTNRIITDVLDPVLDLLDQIAKKPVKTITALLPNAIYFLNSGALSQCVQHLLYPMTGLMEQFSVDPAALGVDLSALDDLDPEEAFGDLAASLAGGLKIKTPDFSAVAGMGRLEKVTSKRTVDGRPVKIDYVKADQPAVLVSLLRYVIGLIKEPENQPLLEQFIANGTQGGNEMFATYSSGITEDMAKMTVDETIEWLYQLLFRERVTQKDTKDDDYIPNIIYTPQKDHTVLYIVLGAVGAAAVAAIVFLIAKRDMLRKLPRRRKSAEQDRQEE